MNKLANKVAVITGGTSGIGLAAARLFLEEGARVVVFARGQAELARVAATLGDRVRAVPGDVTHPVDLARLFQDTQRAWGPVHVVFANAALVKLGSIADTSDETFDEIVATNMKGAFQTIRAASPTLEDGASIIVTSSYLNRIGFSGSSVVAMTKAAVRALVRVAAAELAPRKIRVNALCPGAIETPLWGKLGLPAEVLRAAGEGITAQIPLGRWGTAEEVARAALFLASADAAYVNGSELQVDGGLHQV